MYIFSYYLYLVYVIIKGVHTTQGAFKSYCHKLFNNVVNTGSLKIDILLYNIYYLY